MTITLKEIDVGIYNVIAEGGGQNHDGGQDEFEMIILERVSFNEAIEKAREYDDGTEFRLDKVFLLPDE